jgi:large subunit ribosomal protein L23
MDLHPFEIIRRPVVTEKSTLLQDEDRYTFEVAKSATKHQIKEAVEEAFNVTVVKVNTMTVRGKRRRLGPRFSTSKSWKKAVVQLAPGNTITIFEGV